ncbi:sel1 repeat family protein [Paraburkholderia tropica]|uniref:sel1 repeat family protein n=1 Tax=Paraburkholderia tropica TaxID=92647 RepID=UPI002AB7D29E|nr:sel1 repeat family protein [Paraburkholderia tropica]
MSTETNWLTQIEHDWILLARNDRRLNVGRFYRHILTAHKAGFVPLESVAMTANALLISTISGAVDLGHRLLGQVGVDRHPALRVVHALALLDGRDIAPDVAAAHVVMRDVLSDSDVPERLRGIVFAALGDSSRLGRESAPDANDAVRNYERAFGLGIRQVAWNMGLYWEGLWGIARCEDLLPDVAQALMWYRRGASASEKCARRVLELTAEVAQGTGQAVG